MNRPTRDFFVGLLAAIPLSALCWAWLYWMTGEWNFPW